MTSSLPYLSRHAAYQTPHKTDTFLTRSQLFFGVFHCAHYSSIALQNFPTIEKRLRSLTQFKGPPIEFSNPVIPTQNFVQSHNPEGYFWHLTSRAYFQSRISPRFCFQIPNPEVQIREIPDPEKPVGDPQFRISLRCRV